MLRQMLSPEVLHSLIYRSESDDLDFKQAQYPFDGATDEQKAELLKDILAMANAWRTGDAYILVGYRERRPDPAEVLGIDSSIDDAKLQQFVNSKVNRPIRFRYEEHTHQDKRVGVFVISLQDRPIYLNAPYARLAERVVYVRRGSSTAKADPDEIARMGEQRVLRPSADVALELLDGNDQPLAGARGKVFYAPVRNLPDYTIEPDWRSAGIVLMNVANKDYWRELASFRRIAAAHVQVKLRVRNRSTFRVSHLRIELVVRDEHGDAISAIPSFDLPKRPEKNLPFVASLDQTLARHRRGPAVIQRSSFEDHDGWSIDAGDLLPGQNLVVPESLILVPGKPCTATFDIRVLAAELHEPMRLNRSVIIEGTSSGLTLDDLMRLDER